MDITLKIIVLDRDGVLNVDSVDYIKSADEWSPIEGSIETLAQLSSAGFKIVVASNQSGLGRGLFDEYDLAKIHHKLRYMVEDLGGKVDGIFYCPHLPEDDCSCRKPKTGLLDQIEREFNCSLKGSYFVGDSLKDIQAAETFGCTPILVKTGKGLETLQQIDPEKLPALLVFENLAAAKPLLLSQV
jgi:D-glycero-D-manno-heptose 1,7-bisphosphate phosphatase